MLTMQIARKLISFPRLCVLSVAVQIIDIPKSISSITIALQT